MTTIHEVILDIGRTTISRAKYDQYIKDALKHGANIAVGESIPTLPCACGHVLAEADIEFTGTPEFHTLQLCLVCGATYQLIYTMGLEIDGELHENSPEEYYERYTADMKAAGVENYTLPRIWFEAQQIAIEYVLEAPEIRINPEALDDEQDDPEAPEGWYDDDDDDDDPAQTLMDILEAEAAIQREEKAKAERILAHARIIEKLSPLGKVALECLLELVPDASPETVERVNRILNRENGKKNWVDEIADEVVARYRSAPQKPAPSTTDETPF